MEDIPDTHETASYDLSEVSSDISTGTQDTYLHSNASNKAPYYDSNPIYKNNSNNNNDHNFNDDGMIHTSPHEVSGFPDHSCTVLQMMGDSLPIVKEGRVLKDEDYNVIVGDDDDDDAYDDENRVVVNGISVMDAFDEEQEFTREMNTTKIAFSAYRNAVLHLVHHQPHHRKISGSNDAEKGDVSQNTLESDSNPSKEQEGINDGQIFADNVDVDDANHRMTILEATAKRLVETKAKACFEAVQVANDFMDRRRERKRGRDALFRELLHTSVSPSRIETTAKPYKGAVGGQSNRRVDDGHVGTNNATSVKERAVKKQPAGNNMDAAAVSNKVKNKSAIVDENKCQNFVRLRKSSRHPSCILATLPPFQFQHPRRNIDHPKNGTKENDSKNHSNGDKDTQSETPATYGTTTWISDMAKWRSQRKMYRMTSFQKCGCPDCSVQLTEILST